MHARFVSLMIAAALAGAGLIAWLHPYGSGSSTAQAAAAVSAPPAVTTPTNPGVLTPYLRFSGQGTVTVKPDTVSVWLGVSTTAATSQEALNAASRRMRLIQQRLASLGVAAVDMQTSNVSTWHQTSPDAWQADESLTVTVHDPSRAGALIRDANAAGANEVGGPSFSVSDQKAAYAQALARAIGDARSKAEAVAGQLGVHVTGVVSVDDSLGASQPMAYGAAQAASSPGTPVPISTGTQDINATVAVVFSYAA